MDGDGEGKLEGRKLGKEGREEGQGTQSPSTRATKNQILINQPNL